MFCIVGTILYIQFYFLMSWICTCSQNHFLVTMIPVTQQLINHKWPRSYNKNSNLNQRKYFDKISWHSLLFILYVKVHIFFGMKWLKIRTRVKSVSCTYLQLNCWNIYKLFKLRIVWNRIWANFQLLLTCNRHCHLLLSVFPTLS